MVFVKKWRFFNLKFLCKMDQEKVFFEGSETKEAFLDQKNVSSKINQNLLFSNWLVHGFCQKTGDFLILTFYAKWMKKKCFLKVSKEKNPF